MEHLAARLHPAIDRDRVARIFANAGIEQRHLVQPLDWYGTDHPLEQRNAMAHRAVSSHAAAAARVALERSGFAAGDVDSIVFVSTTVIESPAADVGLVTELGLRPDVRRVPVFGMSSLGGAAGLGLAADLVRAGDAVVLVVCAEANSLTFRPARARGMESLVTLALFSDGAAVAVVSRDRGACRVVGHHSSLVPDSVDLMGFDVDDGGLRWRLSADVPAVAAEWTDKAVTGALASVGWEKSSLDHVLLHPGGAKVVDAVESALALHPSSLDWSREVMRDHGNVSSVTVLLVLERFLAAGPPSGRALLTAMGPGFGFEHVLLECAEPGAV